MRVLFVSGELLAGDLALRLQREGADIRLFVAHPAQQECLNGLVPKTTNWRDDLSWVGQDGLIVFDDVGYGAIQDQLRLDGYRVFGGSAGGDRLEQDRSFAQQVLAGVGLSVAPNYFFEQAEDALQFAREQGGAWVVKQNDHQSHLNYVGVLDDGRDVQAVIASYARQGIGMLSLQRRLNGIEIGVARYFNGRDWVGPIDLNLEHKGLMNQEIGPKTGEMGTLMWFVDSCRLFDVVLAPLKDYLCEVDFRGEIDINCFVDGDTVYPIEVTTRLGCPSTQLHIAMYRSRWIDLLCALADGKAFDLDVYQGYGVVLTLALPPFPFSTEEMSCISSAGMPLLFRSPLTDEESGRLHLEGVARASGEAGDELLLTKSLGYTVFVSGTGSTVEAAQESAYGLARKIVLPKVMYRTDIGDRFLAGEGDRLRSLGWI